MKTKVLLTLLSLLLVLFFAACDEESSDTSDEVYAGTWYGTWFDGEEIKVEVFDSSYKSWEWQSGGAVWIKSEKGDIKKVSDGVIEVEATHEYDNYYGTWDSVGSNTTTGTYVMGEGNTTMTLTVTSTTVYPYVEVGDTADLSKTPTH